MNAMPRASSGTRPDLPAGTGKTTLRIELYDESLAVAGVLRLATGT
jgi:hypothetical protein